MDYFITLNDKSIEQLGEAVEKPITVIEELKETLAETIQEKDAIIAEKDEEIEELIAAQGNVGEFVQVSITKPGGVGLSVLYQNVRVDSNRKEVGVDLMNRDAAYSNLFINVPNKPKVAYQLDILTPIRVTLTAFNSTSTSGPDTVDGKYYRNRITVPANREITPNEVVGAMTVVV